MHSQIWWNAIALYFFANIASGMLFVFLALIIFWPQLLAPIRCLIRAKNANWGKIVYSEVVGTHDVAHYPKEVNCLVLGGHQSWLASSPLIGYTSHLFNTWQSLLDADLTTDCPIFVKGSSTQCTKIHVWFFRSFDGVDGLQFCHVWPCILSCNHKIIHIYQNVVISLTITP